MMSIKDIVEKIKSVRQAHHLCSEKLEKERVFVVVLIAVVAMGSFGLGRLSMEKKTKLKLDESGAAMLASSLADGTILKGEGALNKPAAKMEPSSTAVFVSKNGTKYYYIFCKSGEKIKEANRVWFASAEEAERFGYTAAANCKQNSQ